MAGEFLFSVQWLDFSADSVLLAMGHALFTLSVGAAIGVAYGAYAPDRVPVGRSIMAVAIFDTAVAIAAGVAIFPVLFANHMEPAAGPALLFLSVPYAFGNLPQGEIYGALFFLLTTLAALGSAIALLEPSVASLLQYTRLKRWQAALGVAVIVWMLGAAVAASLGEDSELPALLPALDRLTTTFLLPLGALAVAVLVGTYLDEERLRVEMYRESRSLFRLWLLLLRCVAPLVILVVWFRALMPD
jgi:NSS family neurotransmitter:Na+ symporter